MDDGWWKWWCVSMLNPQIIDKEDISICDIADKIKFWCVSILHSQIVDQEYACITFFAEQYVCNIITKINCWSNFNKSISNFMIFVLRMK